MKLRNITILILILGLSIQFCLGQEFEEGENWMQEFYPYQSPTLTFRFDKYSREDLVKFREKLDLIKSAKSADEWNGIYNNEFSELGVNLFILDSKAGFVSFYLYTCYPELRTMNYGNVINTSDYVEILPEFSGNSPRKSLPERFVKVSWGERRYLVEESSLEAFAEKAVGIYIEPSNNEDEMLHKWSNYWISGDSEKELTGLPVLPVSYKKFERSPIETKIISVGKRTIETEKDVEDYQNTEEMAFYTVTIGAGKNKKVKEGMILFFGETQEEIIITKVNQNSAVGKISRSIDDNKNDYCEDNESNQIPCPKIKSSLKVKTRVGYLWY